MNPENLSKVVKISEEIDDFWWPTCHKGIFFKKYDYCPWHGQRLDWNGRVGGK